MGACKSCERTVQLQDKPQSRVIRRLRQWRWSLLKRVVPYRTLEIAFDDDLVLAVRAIDRLGRRVYLVAAKSAFDPDGAA